MTYAIVIVVFLALPAVAAVARIAAYQRCGGHGRPDLESGHTLGFRPARAPVHDRQPLLRVHGDVENPEGRARRRRVDLRPVAAPTAAAVRPSPTWAFIRQEFDRDMPDHRGRAA